MAKLPSYLQEDTIEDMSPGDGGWTVPWAMYADKHGDLWLNGNYTLNSRSDGTVQMYVARSEADGLYRVNVRQCGEYRWSRGDGCYLGSFRPVPVAALDAELPPPPPRPVVEEGRNERSPRGFLRIEPEPRPWSAALPDWLKRMLR